MNIKFKYKKFLYLLKLLIMLNILLFTIHIPVSATDVVGVAYSNDPNTGHASFWGPSVVITFNGRAGGTVTMYKNGNSLGSTTAIPSQQNPNQAQVGGWSGSFSGASAGDVFRVTPGGAQCTIVRRNGFVYCGVAAPPQPPENPPPGNDPDGDGVPNDGTDKCPDVPGTMPDGCADSDGDGTSDRVDQCPGQGGPDWNNGCPEGSNSSTSDTCNGSDSDGDGVCDGPDLCPSEGGPAWNAGCPSDTEYTDNGVNFRGDLDADGIPDSQDLLCPTEPGPIENNGCAYRPDPTAACNTAVRPGILQNVFVRTEPEVVNGNQLATISYRDEPITITDVSAPDADGLIWYEVEANGTQGWIREDSFQNPMGINCPPGIEEVGIVDVASTGLFVFVERECNDQFDRAASLSVEQQRFYASTANPCGLLNEDAEDAAREVRWGRPFTNGTLAAMRQCPLQVPRSVRIYNSLAEYDDELDSGSDGESSARYVQSWSSQMCQPADSARTYSSNEEVIASCIRNVSPHRLRDIKRTAELLGIKIPLEDVSTNEPICAILRAVGTIGIPTEAETQFFQELQNGAICTMSQSSALEVLQRAIFVDVDLASLLQRLEDETFRGLFCSEPEEQLNLSAGSQPPPEGSEECDAGLINAYQNLIDKELVPEEHQQRIREAEDVCAAIARYLINGRVPDIPRIPADYVPLQPSEDGLAFVVASSEVLTTEAELPPTEDGQTPSSDRCRLLDMAISPCPFPPNVDAYFAGALGADQPTDIYQVVDGLVQLRGESTVDAEYSPSPSPTSYSMPIFAFYRRAWNAEAQDYEPANLVIEDLHEYILSAPIGYSYDIESGITWHPLSTYDNPVIWVTLVEDASGEYVTVELALNAVLSEQINDMEEIRSTERILEGFRNPRTYANYYLLIEEVNGETSRLVRVNIDSITISRQVMPGQPDTAYCGDALGVFGSELDYDLLFICDDSLYRGNLDGITLSDEMLIHAYPGMQNIELIPGVPTDVAYQMVSFDDGSLIYAAVLGETVFPDRFGNLPKIFQLIWVGD